MASKKSKKPAILNEQNVKDFHESFGDLRLNGYQIATEEISLQLEHILQNSKDLSSLKKELNLFLQSRKKLTTFLIEKADNQTIHYLF